MDSTRAAYDDVAEVYHETLDPDGSGLRDPILAGLLGDVRDQRVLALACGQGRDARLLADLGATVVGVDVSTRLLAFAQRFEREQPRGIEYVRGDARDLETLDGASFDAVVCHMALMDIPELAPVAVAVARVLRPGGVFVASVVHPCYGPHIDAVHS